MKVGSVGTFAAAALFWSVPHAWAADPMIVYQAPSHAAPAAIDTSRVPACEDPRVQRRIASRFSHRERTYWHSGLQLLGFAEVRQVAYRPWGLEFHPRRFCEGRALVNDGTDRPVVYAVIEGAGFAGTGFGVEWCVGGLDRNLAYAPDCKMAGP